MHLKMLQLSDNLLKKLPPEIRKVSPLPLCARLPPRILLLYTPARAWLVRLLHGFARI